MKNTYILIALLGLASACGEQGSEAEKKKKELEAARAESQELRQKIAQLETELKELDPEFAKETDKSILVSTFVPEPKPFEHKVEVRGSVASRRNVMMSAQVGGTIETVHVKEGQRVGKGQVLISLDADITRNSIAEVKTSLELATSIYEKQAKLWEQKIGTEVQYLEAKNNKESLESRLKTLYAQLDQAVVRAPFNGTVDEVPAREGELAAPGLPLVRITSPEDMYIQADVSERFIGKFSAGDKVEIYFPVQDTTLISSVSSISQVINPDNRTFSVEVKLPRTSLTLKPNQVTVLRLRDYYNRSAIVLPTKLIQLDDAGEYVFAVEKTDSATVATKLHVKTGFSYDNKTEILGGIKGSELLVEKGFRDLTEGVEIKIAGSDSTGKMAKK